MKIPNILIYFFVLFNVKLINSKPNPTKTIKDRQLSFAIPAFLLGGLGGGGSNNQGNYNNGPNYGNLPNYNSDTRYNSQYTQSGNGGLGSNLFQKATITRTVLRTVTTVTQPVFRTCTMSAGPLIPCAGRRKRSTELGVGGMLEPELDNFNMHIIIGSTTIIDQAKASMVLNLDKEVTEITNKTINVNPSTVPIIEPSEPILDQVNSDELFHGYKNFVKTPLVTYEDDEAEEERALEARLNLGTTTITKTFPVTAVVNSTVSGGAQGMMQVLTVSYLGCMPPSVPVTTTNC